MITPQFNTKKLFNGYDDDDGDGGGSIMDSSNIEMDIDDLSVSKINKNTGTTTGTVTVTVDINTNTTTATATAITPTTKADKIDAIMNDKMNISSGIISDIADDDIINDNKNSYLKTVFKSDVFSFGVIIWEVICCKPIYNDLNIIQIRDMILNDKRISLISFDLLPYISNKKKKKEKEKKKYLNIQQLTNDCWQQNPKCRPTFTEIIKHLKSIIFEF